MSKLTVGGSFAKPKTAAKKKAPTKKPPVKKAPAKPAAKAPKDADKFLSDLRRYVNRAELSKVSKIGALEALKVELLDEWD